MQYILLKENRSWTDEFDTESFIAMPEDLYEKYLTQTNKELNKLHNHETSCITIGFGTNEAHEIKKVADYWNDISIIKINKQEFEVLKILFGDQTRDTVRFGTNSYFFPLSE